MSRSLAKSKPSTSSRSGTLPTLKFWPIIEERQKKEGLASAMTSMIKQDSMLSPIELEETWNMNSAKALRTVSGFMNTPTSKKYL